MRHDILPWNFPATPKVAASTGSLGSHYTSDRNILGIHNSFQDISRDVSAGGGDPQDGPPSGGGYPSFARKIKSNCLRPFACDLRSRAKGPGNEIFYIVF